MNAAPQCSTCGKFFDGSKGYAWQMVYSGGAIPTPDRELYRCAKCVEKVGPFEPQSGIVPRYSCGMVEATA